MESGNEELMLEGASRVRKLLSIEHKPPIQEVVNSPGMLDRLMDFLRSDDHPELQFEACWALTNVPLTALLLNNSHKLKKPSGAITEQISQNESVDLMLACG
jgi:hypothetical protein